ncbi:MAG: phosphoribosylformylglycinamidine cyclo-ligase [Fimbriimonadaceae bacterium]|nr:phosphoribosylformylglycinamidine cyclo-ligase [Fimbriimonadaceae bacterium]QYK56156.1 MAG: phosphoribosylformylglycinamidine cyclo-ligase [Fimbriimonadaceae bacterium]
MSDLGMTYASAGVDVGEAERVLRIVAPRIRETHNERVLGGIGGFGAMFSAVFSEMRQPVLVTSIDGVGTKTKVAAMAGDFSNIGFDIVNHCVNDILCQGARPLYFLDYFGCSRLSGPIFEQVLAGAVEACLQVDCALVGGETAEMPGVYHDGEIDIVGAITGVVEADKRLPRIRPQAGDRIIGIASDGLHTNGYSLARKVLFEQGGLSVRDPMPDSEVTIGEEVLKPHRCYAKPLLPIIDDLPGLYSLAHVTGGGIAGNLSRVIPANMRAEISKRAWEPLPIFRFIQRQGNVPEDEMYRVFNMGIGMVAVVSADAASELVRRLNEMGEAAAEIGQLRTGSQDVQFV